jgi:F420-0:gamma-glutamyl ligase
VTGKSLNIPVVIVRGYEYAKLEKGDISVMLRDEVRDLFR